MVEGQLGQRADGRHRVQVIDVKLALRVPRGGVGPLEHRDVQLLLAREVVVEHPLRGAGAGGDLVYPRAGVAVPGELAERHVQDFLARALRVALPLRALRGHGTRHAADSTVTEPDGSLPGSEAFTRRRCRAEIMNYQVS